MKTIKIFYPTLPVRS